jgi:PAS domain S-box-containing protein
MNLGPSLLPLSLAGSPRWAARAARGAASAAAALSVCVVIGWIFDIPRLRRLLMDAPQMSISIACCGLSVSAALWVLSWATTGPDEVSALAQAARRHRNFPAKIGLAIALLALFRLATFVLSLRYGLNALWFPLVVVSQGVMSPTTAGALLLTGSSLLLASRTADVRLYSTLACSNIVILWFLALSYAMGSKPPEALQHTALPTTLTIFLLNIGLLCVRPDSRVVTLASSPYAGGSVFRLLAPALMILPVLLEAIQLVLIRAHWLSPDSSAPLLAATTGALCIGGLGVLAWRLEASDAQRRRTEQLFGQVFEASLHGLFMVDATGKITLVNATGLALFGYALEELRGAMIERLVPELAREQHVQQRRAFQATHSAGLHREVLALRHDGTSFFAEISLSRVNVSGQPMVLASVLDISEVKRARDARQRLAAIVDSSDDAIVSKTLAGVITTWNPGAEKLFGYSAEQAIGQPIRMLLPADRVGDETDILARIARGETLRTLEVVRVHRDGSEVQVSATISPVRDDNGIIVGASKIARDIGERKRTEAALRTKTEELERTNTELERFAYVASHDLQEPLRMVSSFVGLLEKRYRDQLDDQAKRYIFFAVDGAKRMQQLIQDLLMYSRTGSEKLERGPVEMQRVFELAQRNLHAAIEEAGARISADPLPRVSGAEGLLVQLLQNLLGNGLKYRSERTPAIHVSAQKQQGFWEFSVRDNGIGIERQYWQRIFLVFQRLHTRERYSGTGIGLAICERIVSRHGGRIWLDSELGQGSDFRFTLPAL